MSKKLTITTWAFVALISISVCNKARTTVISTNNDGNIQRIEYRGQIIFNQEKNGIDHISPDGFIEYKKDNQEITAEPEKNGRIAYTYNHQEKTYHLIGEGQAFLAEAVKQITTEIAKQRAGRNR